MGGAARLALLVALACIVGYGSSSSNALVATPTEASATCSASEVRKTVVRFITAGNRRERKAIDALVARDGLFHWFTIDDQDRRRSAGFYERDRLVRYLAGRRGGVNFRLRSFGFNGRSSVYGHFEYRLTATSPSVHVLYDGKGAATCSTPHRIAVWSMGSRD